MSVHPVEPKEGVAEQGESNLGQMQRPAEGTPVAGQDTVSAQGEASRQEDPRDAPVVAAADVDGAPPVPPVTGPTICPCRGVEMPPRLGMLLSVRGFASRGLGLTVHRRSPPVLTWRCDGPCKAWPLRACGPRNRRATHAVLRNKRWEPHTDRWSPEAGNGSPS